MFLYLLQYSNPSVQGHKSVTCSNVNKNTVWYVFRSGLDQAKFLIFLISHSTHFSLLNQFDRNTLSFLTKCQFLFYF